MGLAYCNIYFINAYFVGISKLIHSGMDDLDFDKSFVTAMCFVRSRGKFLYAKIACVMPVCARILIVFQSNSERLIIRLTIILKYRPINNTNELRGN